MIRLNSYVRGSAACREGWCLDWAFQSATETSLLRRASDSVHRQSDGHSVEDSETERRHDVTSPKLFHQMFLHTQGNLSHRSGHMDPSLVSEIVRRLGQHRGHHNVAKKGKKKGQCRNRHSTDYAQPCGNTENSSSFFLQAELCHYG